jgi:hypothetical protein
MAMQSSEAFRKQTVVVATMVLACLAMINTSVSLSAEEVEALIQRVVAQATRSGIAVDATRHLEAGTVSGKHRGWMNVETTLTPSGVFTWHVIDEGGSERTRDKVFRGVLEAEEQAWREGGHDAAALSLENYEIVPIDGANGLRFELKPRRNDEKLITGTLTVDADGHPVLLEGKLAKSPSFWVRSVTVVRRYARFGGVSLPVVVESLADVKIFGKSSFSMRYNYNSINGHPVDRAASSESRFGPSPQLLALHTQLHERQ